MHKIDLHPTTQQLRQFGWVGLLVFPAVGGIVLWRFTGGEVDLAVQFLFGLGVFCGLAATLWPKALWLVYAAMTILGFCIGSVVTPVILATIYFGLFTPLAIWFRLRGRDTMKRRVEPDAASYWSPHRDVSRPRPLTSYLRLY